MRLSAAIIGASVLIAVFSYHCPAQGLGAFQANHEEGEFYIRKHDLKTATRYLQQAYDLDPQNYDNAYDLALSYLELGALEASRSILTATIQIHDRAELHNLLGELEAKRGHIQAAAEEYRRAAQMDPSEKNLFDLGTHLLQYRGFQAAETVFSYGVARYPKSAELAVGLGIAFYSLGKYEDAIGQLCRAVDLNPVDTRALQFLGKMYDVAPEMHSEVAARLERFAREYPNNAAADYYYALSLRSETGGRTNAAHQKQAQELLERAVRLDAGLADAHFELGSLYEEEHEERRAVREYQAAIKLAPERSKYHYRLAHLYQKTGNTQLASAEFRRFEELKGRQ